MNVTAREPTKRQYTNGQEGITSRPQDTNPIFSNTGIETLLFPECMEGVVPQAKHSDEAVECGHIAVPIAFCVMYTQSKAEVINSRLIAIEPSVPSVHMGCAQHYTCQPPYRHAGILLRRRGHTRRSNLRELKIGRSVYRIAQKQAPSSETHR